MEAVMQDVESEKTASQPPASKKVTCKGSVLARVRFFGTVTKRSCFAVGTIKMKTLKLSLSNFERA
jgi:hypothetical protein